MNIYPHIAKGKLKYKVALVNVGYDYVMLLMEEQINTRSSIIMCVYIMYATT